MIDRAELLATLRPLVTRLEADVRGRLDDEAAGLAAALRAEFDAARGEGRTGMEWEDWRDGEVTQAAVAWVLGCVFVRFLEDNALIDAPLLSGPGPRRQAALEHRSEYFRAHPERSDREHLAACFEDVARHPAVAPLFDRRHNPLWRLGPTADGARELRETWTALDPQSGELAHDFTDPDLGTRFLGDLYQDLSEAAKKRYALLQTPHFVEAFILDRTLEPALDEFGLQAVRMIDPACGSGHFLIGTFERLFARWREREPATVVTELAQRALDAVHGVDLNPYATAIARFRLVIAALKACAIGRLADAPAFALHLATGDSLIHGRPERGQLEGYERYDTTIGHVYATEDADELARILGRQRYHAVVGNPPYIQAADAALRDAYRARYESCHGKFALTVPFMERLFELADVREDGRPPQAGYVGQITANSFMKREFGAKLVERFLPGVDLDTLIDSSGAYIPGHGTPTVIAFGRKRPPTRTTLRVLDGLRGEPAQPADPATAHVWSSILARVDAPGTEDRFVRSSDVERREFEQHPMTLGAGRDLRKVLEGTERRLSALAESAGIVSFTLEDDLFVIAPSVARRRRMDLVRTLIEGDVVRDWTVSEANVAVFPYDDDLSPVVETFAAPWQRWLWPGRTLLAQNKMFGGQTKVEAGLKWYEWGRLTRAKLRTPLTITWGEVATHNHFVLDRGGKVFKQTAPVIKLPEGAGEADHLWLLGVLNSSTACFWLKQVCQTKGSSGMGRGVYDEAWEFFFQLNATKVKELPLPQRRATGLPAALDAAATERARLLDGLAEACAERPVRDVLAELERRDAELTARMIALQEELDWVVMRDYGLVPADVVAADPGSTPPLALGERAFEVALAREVARGETETTWFARHGSTPITEPPPGWPAEHRALVQRRLELIADDPDVGLLERPEHKRRWTRKPWAERVEQALSAWVLDRLEAGDVWADGRLRSVSELADVVRRDRALVEACEVIAASADANVARTVGALVAGQSVAFLAALRHKPPGLRKRAQWEQVWDLQRAEDRGETVGRIPVPPRYATGDFASTTAWSLRGKLDVPKERFTSHPGAERGADRSLVVGWAGWDELTRARALATRIIELSEHEAADAQRLAPLLAGLLELLPWIAQWHPDSDPEYGGAPADFYSQWLDGQLAALGLTRDDLGSWRPPASGRRAR